MVVGSRGLGCLWNQRTRRALRSSSNPNGRTMRAARSKIDREVPATKGETSVKLAILGWLTVCSVSCHHRPGAQGFCPGEIYGADLPQVGANSRLEVSRSTRSDSLLANAAMGELVSRIRWSSDSLASMSRPVGAVLDLTHRGTHARITTYFFRDTVLANGVLEHVLRVAAGEYALKVRMIGTATFDTTLMVRAGFADSALVFLQRGGTRVCY